MPKAFWEKSYKLFAQSPRVKTKNWFFKGSRQKCSSGHVDCRPQLYQKSFSQIEKKDHFKIGFSSKKFPSTRRKQMWELYPVFFVQSQNSVKTWKLFHSNNVFLKKFDWRWWKLNWQPCQYVWICENVSHIVRKRQKNFIFPNKYNFPSLFHWRCKGNSTILQNFFCPKSETSHFCRSFHKIIFFKKTLWTCKSHFWQACQNHFCQKLY